MVSLSEISKTCFFISQANQLWTRRASIAQGHGVSRDRARTRTPRHLGPSPMAKSTPGRKPHPLHMPSTLLVFTLEEVKRSIPIGGFYSLLKHFMSWA